MGMNFDEFTISTLTPSAISSQRIPRFPSNVQEATEQIQRAIKEAYLSGYTLMKVDTRDQDLDPKSRGFDIKVLRYLVLELVKFLDELLGPDVVIRVVFNSFLLATKVGLLDTKSSEPSEVDEIRTDSDLLPKLSITSLDFVQDYDLESERLVDDKKQITLICLPSNSPGEFNATRALRKELQKCRRERHSLVLILNSNLDTATPVEMLEFQQIYDIFPYVLTKNDNSSSRSETWDVSASIPPEIPVRFALFKCGPKSKYLIYVYDSNTKEYRVFGSMKYQNAPSESALNELVETLLDQHEKANPK